MSWEASEVQDIVYIYALEWDKPSEGNSTSSSLDEAKINEIERLYAVVEASWQLAGV
jgi:hypothetical protein